MASFMKETLESCHLRSSLSTISSNTHDAWAPSCYCKVCTAVCTSRTTKNFGKKLWGCRLYNKNDPDAYCNFFEWYDLNVQCDKDFQILRQKRRILFLQESLEKTRKWKNISIVACCLLFLACVFLGLMLWKLGHSDAFAVKRSIR